MNFFNNKKLFFTQSAAAVVVSISSILGGVGVLVTYIASTDQVQKIYIKHKLLSLKLAQPSHMNKKSYISREADIEWLAKILPKRLINTSDRFYMIGNPRGYGKSALVKEMAFKRDEICKNLKMPSGPVLFTDFQGIKSGSDAEKRILETIQPLFFNLFAFNQGDELSHKLKLVKEVALELSEDEDEKVVMWVLDSFSTLVSKALASTEEKKAEYDCVISILFNLNTAIIPIAVCSSATTAGALNEINPHIWVRTSAWFPPVVENKTGELYKYVKFLNSESGNLSVLSEELVDDLINSVGGCLLLYTELLNRTNVADELKKIKTNHTQSLKSVLDLQKGQVFSEVSLERYELLLAVGRGEKILPYGNPAAEYLLSKHGKIQAFLGIHPEGHLIFALPMTNQSLNQIEPLVKAKQL